MISLTEGASKGPSHPKTSEKIYQLKATVVDVSPPIWRRLLVKESMPLARFHDMLQIVFEWYDYQLHLFVIDGAHYGNPVHREGSETVEDDRDVLLGDLDLQNRSELFYHYAFGAGWTVEFQFEKLVQREKGIIYPFCAAGERAGPPEDCGGPEGYRELTHALLHPDELASKEWLEWLGGTDKYDPLIFDRDKANKALRTLRK